MKRYDQNFKDEALKLSDDIGVKKACEQLNLNYRTLTGWRKLRAKKEKAGKKSDKELQNENARHGGCALPFRSVTGNAQLTISHC